MPRQNVLDMHCTRIYTLLVQKAERKGRTKEEAYEVIRWLTGYDGIHCLIRPAENFCPAHPKYSLKKIKKRIKGSCNV